MFHKLYYLYHPISNLQKIKNSHPFDKKKDGRKCLSLNELEDESLFEPVG